MTCTKEMNMTTLTENIIVDFLESLKDATQQTKENPLRDESAPRVTEIAKAHANDGPGLNFLIQSLSFLTDVRYRMDITEWYAQYRTSLILRRGILDAFVEGLGRFPELATSEFRIAALDTIRNLAPHGNDYFGPHIDVYVGYALLTARVLGRDTAHLDHARVESSKAAELDWENMPDDESETRGQELERNTKEIWFCTGDIFTEAILFLASLEGRHNQDFVPMDFLRTCCESYGEGQGRKISPLRVDDNEWHAAQTGEANQRRSVWKNVALKLQSAAWGSLKAPPLLPAESIALAEASNEKWAGLGYDRREAARKLVLHHSGFGDFIRN
ncbi:hypothetical protein BDV24DRAFT_11696 [Aspergillus arachidicola]|uniref:Uncharacterized protein n=1 Tax=Aspergillus arachidicola TaxID=656916 RepID=A0A5N6XPN2_9EURO|nr:hypothetical protein BDV24DRAFT_11696 [Aspergillus arachidicola]